MYLGISVENFVTVSLMFLVFMLALHLAAQAGLHVANWLPGGNS